MSGLDVICISETMGQYNVIAKAIDANNIV